MPLNLLIKKSLCLICICLLGSTALFAQGGGIDSTFGVNGLISMPSLGYAVYDQQSLGDGATLIYEYNIALATERVCKYDGAGSLINSFGSGGCIITRKADSTYFYSEKIVYPGKCFLTIKQQQSDKSIVMLDSNWKPVSAFKEVFLNLSSSSYVKILGAQSTGKILLLIGEGNLYRILRFTATGDVDSTLKVTPFYAGCRLLANDKIALLKGDSIWLLQENGSPDTLFKGFEGLPLIAKWNCIPGPQSAPKSVSYAFYNKFTHEYLLSFNWMANYCSHTFYNTITETIRFTEKGSRVDVTSLYQSDAQTENVGGHINYSTKKTCLPLSDKTYLITTESYEGLHVSYSYSVSRISLNCSFGVPAIGTQQYPYFQFSKINEKQLLWVRNFNDTQYLSRINIGLMPLVTDFTADTRSIRKGELIRFTPNINRAVSKYEWKLNSSFCVYMDGTDSSSANPVVAFNKEGKYDVQLKAYLEDTTVLISKTAYIEVLPPAGQNELTKGEIIIYPNPTNGGITIESEQSLLHAQCEVFDMQGRLIQCIITSNDHQLLVGLPQSAGIYFIKLRTEAGKQWVQKVLKE